MNTPANAELQSLGDRLKRGDESVLAVVLRDIGPQIEKALRSRFAGSLSEQDLDDVLSTALLRLWNARSKFSNAEGRLDAYFYIIARNAALDIFRSRKKTVMEPAVPSERVSASCREIADVFGRTNRQDVRERVRKAIDQLDGRERAIVAAWLSAKGEPGWAKTAAEDFGLTPNHVRVLRFRAIARLRQLLHDDLTPQAERPKDEQTVHSRTAR